MKLTDMGIDCLEAVLEHLPFKNLVYAADSNKRLQHAARFVYARKYGEKKGFELSSSKIEFFRKRKFYFKDWVVHVDDLKFGFQLLRCFGHQFRCISYQKDGNSDEIDRFYIEYLNEFCSETVERFFIERCYDGFLNNFTKPFNRVEMVRIDESRIDLQSAKDILARLFPNMRTFRLKTECFPLEESKCIANHFPRLKKLIITIGECYQCECTDVIVSTLRLNPQLELLELSQFRENNLPIIQTMNEYNKNLEYFQIDLAAAFFSVDYDGTVWHLKHVKHLNADVDLDIGYFYPYIIPYIIPFTFDQLEALSITLVNPFTDNFYNFCTQNPSLKSLNVRCTYESYDVLINDALKITKSIPLLEKLEFLGMQIDKAIDIINAFDYHTPLKTVKFRLFYRSVRQPISYLKTRLTKGWSIFSIEEGYSLFAFRLVTVKRQS